VQNGADVKVVLIYLHGYLLKRLYFMKIISYNVNGIRAAMNKGLLDWLAEEQPDVLSLQETKANKDQVDTAAIEEMGYHHYWYSAQKKGYSGVAILSKNPPDHEVKMAFLRDIQTYIDELKKSRPNLVVSGDYNICHKAIDIHNPERNKKTSGFLPEEREWMSGLIESGFIDSFRHFNEGPDQYSWWSYRSGARKRNLGWRLDYHMVSEGLRPKLKSASILDQIVHSDHCPVVLELG